MLFSTATAPQSTKPTVAQPTVTQTKSTPRDTDEEPETALPQPKRRRIGLQKKKSTGEAPVRHIEDENDNEDEPITKLKKPNTVITQSPKKRSISATDASDSASVGIKSPKVFKPPVGKRKYPFSLFV